MKKLITICLLTAVSYSVKAQTASETIQWINAKKVDIRLQKDQFIDEAQNFDSEKISSHLFPSIEDNNKYGRFIKWADITDISFDNKKNQILIKGKVVSKSGQNYIIMSCNVPVDKSLIDKMIKALTHMATLKGAILVKDDLFKN